METAYISRFGCEWLATWLLGLLALALSSLSTILIVFLLVVRTLALIVKSVLAIVVILAVVILAITLAWEVANHLALLVEFIVEVGVVVVVKEGTVVDGAKVSIEVGHGERILVHEHGGVHAIEGEVIQLCAVIAELLH